MVRGIESFRKWFRGYEDQYVIIGGTACDLLMSEEGLDFRATKDLDLVLIVEAVDATFGMKFWEYVITSVSFGRPEATDDEIIAAARASHAHSFIRRLPEGYDTFRKNLLQKKNWAGMKS